ncbi:MAG: hypothetical protein ACRC20_14905 [Segniliparus sp.]|uniref:hypothetical protein n=1 Tax=Segniliparus sp. TaxID=2804064 RepID=UPI003F3C5642
MRPPGVPCLGPLLRLGPVRLVAGLAPLVLSAGCGFITGNDRVTIATATVTVTPESSSQPPTAASTSPVAAPAAPNEPAELHDLQLGDPSAFTNGPGRWSFSTASGTAVCKFVAGENGFCHVTDDSGPAWSPSSVCDLHRDQDPDGAQSSLVGWDGDYRQKACHTLLGGDWPDSAPALADGKKLILQVDPDHGATVTCGQRGEGLTCANSAGHGFTISKGSVKLW